MANEKRLIDASKLYEDMMDEYRKANYCDSCLDTTINLIDDAPTVDAVEVVHGRWEYHTNASVQCSACGGVVLMRFKFCPNCGAKMDGERKDNAKERTERKTNPDAVRVRA